MLLNMVKILMTAAKKSGANVVIMTDYDLTGINIASFSPKDMPWIDVLMIGH